MLSKKKPISKGHILQEGIPKHWNLFIKNCVFILTCLNFSHLQSTLHLMQYTYRDIFPTARNSYWTHRFWCCSVLLQFFCFTSSTWAKCLPLRTFFIRGNNKKFAWGEIRWIGRVGHRGSCHFGSKTAEHSVWLGLCAHKSAIMKWADVLKQSSKQIHWSQMQSLRTTPASTLIQMGS